ncbi:hypothetical protein ACSBR1_035585 [Camellia fascicularis]
MKNREAKMENQIEHFSHEHPLTLQNYIIPEPCLVCWQGITSPMYLCKEELCCGSFRIHKSCSELPREMPQHPFHPHHSLTLLPKPPYDSGTLWCNACGKMSWAFTYHCSVCQFDLDVSCASLSPIKIEDPYHQIQLHHPHPLIVCDNKTNFKFPCSGCKQPINGSRVYVCLDCNCLLDESCAKWPSQIDHPFHPQHPLTLLVHHPWNSTSSRCRACGKVLEGFTFHCSECNFSLDARCASLMPTQNSEAKDELQIQQLSLSHTHPLIPCQTKMGFRLSCDACQLHFDDSSVYICLECNFLLHKSCADLPREVKHSFYHQHTLTLLEYLPRQLEESFDTKQILMANCHPSNPGHNGYVAKLASRKMEHSLNCRGKVDVFKGHFQCHACYQYTSGFAYVCAECTIFFDIRCPFSKPRLIKSELHHHPLAFFTVKSKELNCHACNRSFRTPFFRCVECDFNLHVKCLPTLPPTAKDKHHRHPLTLTNSPIKDRPDEDENAEFYCDACEERRELYERTYYCKECHYVAHVHCLLSEILPILEEEWSLACKLEETKLDISASGCEDNTGISISQVLMIEEIMKEEGTELEGYSGADEVEMASSSSRKVFSSVSTGNEVMAKGVSSVMASKAEGARIARDSSLIEPDEEIDVLPLKVESQTIELKATERRLKELEERSAQHVASALPNSGDSTENVQPRHVKWAGLGKPRPGFTFGWAIGRPPPA